MSKILVIDDDEMIRYVITLMLESDGFEVNEAGNGKEAMDYIKKQSFDLVITDIEMPEMNGFEIINKLHKDFPNVKIVVISGAGFSYDRGNTFNKAKKTWSKLLSGKTIQL